MAIAQFPGLVMDCPDAATLARFRADCNQRPFVLFLFDLDRFKQVNDSVGIAVGDSILLTLARRLGRLLKPQDTLARLSGDQFALIRVPSMNPGAIEFTVTAGASPTAMHLVRWIMPALETA